MENFLTPSVPLLRNRGIARRVTLVSRIAATLYLLFSLAAVAGPAQAQDRSDVTIGMVLDGPWERNDEVVQLFEEEITRVNESDFDITFRKSISGNHDPATIRAEIDRLLFDPQIDLIIAVGPLASMDAARRSNLRKPVIASFVLESETQGIPRTQRGTSGVRNLSYLESVDTFREDLGAFQAVSPFTKLAFLANGPMLRAVDGLHEQTRSQLALIGIESEVIEVGESAEVALARIPDDVEAVYIAPLIQLRPGEFDILIQGLIDRRLPSFSYLGREDVERGVLAGLTADSIFPRYARRVALNVQRILLGEPAAEIPVAISRNEELSLNMSTARAIRLRPTFEVLTEAVIVNPSSSPPLRELSLLNALEQALASNADLQAKRFEVEAGDREIGIAGSRLLPQLDAALTGVMIDDDRAGASMGAAVERTLTGRLTLTQLLWSEAARANVDIQKKLQLALEVEETALRLDVALDAATAYVGVLRAQTLERIRRDDLRLTRSNLELARIRESIGVSGPAEVYRWESELASGKREAIRANSQRNVAEIELNRILNRPLEESFSTQEVGLSDPALPAVDGQLDRYIDDPWSFRVMRRYLTEQALENSPELAALDAAIEAQERFVSSSSRRFYSPTLALRGEVAQELGTGGTGADLAELSPADDTDWSISLDLSLPLFEGGERNATLSQARMELDELRRRRVATAERVEQFIRSTTHLAGASYAAIGLTAQSAEAARQNLELVTDAYSRGSVRIIDLLDAQTAARNAEQAAADAIHDFMLDLFEVERALGAFTFLAPPAERIAWFQSLEAYFEEAEEEDR